MKNITRFAAAAVAFASLSTIGAVSAQAQGRGDGPIVYVTSQGLYYDSIITARSLPNKGKFQKLEFGGATGLMTEFGPGDKDHHGGRWWIDLDDNGVRDDSDMYFSCPLLGPGRITP
jgi:hypothetical protein